MGDAEQQRVRELLAFLGPETRSDVKAAAVRCVAGLTGSREGRQLLLASAPGLVGALLALTGRDPGSESGALAREAYGALINLAAEEPGAGAGAGGALQAGLPDLLDRLLDRGYPLADQVAALLANLSREEASGRHLLAALQLRPQPQPQQGAGPGPGLARLMDAFCTDGFNAGASLHHVGPLLANLTQLPEARSVLLDTSRQVRCGEAGRDRVQCLCWAEELRVRRAASLGQEVAPVRWTRKRDKDIRPELCRFPRDDRGAFRPNGHSEPPKA